MSNTSRVKAGRVSALDDHLGYWLRVVSNHVSHSFAGRVERHGVTVAEWVVLRALHGEKGIRPGLLAERLGLTRGAVSKLVDRLVAKALIACDADATDRRAQSLRLLPAGKALVPILAAHADENDRVQFGHLSRVEKATLGRLLRGLAARHELTVPPMA